MKFTFNLNEQEAQKVLDALIKQPYIEVVDVINKIQQQAIEQRKEQEKLEKQEETMT